MDPIKKSSERSRFAVPVAVAVAAHAFLFFGFAPPRVQILPKVPAETPPKSTDVFDLQLIPPETDPEASAGSNPRSVSSPPTQAEVIPAVIPSSAMVMPIVRIEGPVDPRISVVPSERPRFGNVDGFPSGSLTIGSMDLDNTPRVAFQARPNYPFTLRNQGISGEVVVNFLVDEQGRVSDVRIVRSSHSEFEQPTVNAVARWRFEPGKRQGRTVRFRMSQTVSFSLGE